MDENKEKKYTEKDKQICIGRMLLIDFIIISVWLFTASGNEQFAAHFSFASTVTSIILSVLAIFMSVSNESKTQTIREKIEQEAETITKLSAEMKEKIIGLSDKMDSVVTSTSNIEAKIYTGASHVEIASSERKGELK